MSARYAPLPSSHTDPLSNAEMDAAFDDDGDDDDDDDHHAAAHAETRPLYPLSRSRSRSHSPSPPPARHHPLAHAHTPSTPAAYDFENFDYASYPPPGSPPPPSSTALPNDYGNSNGLVPSTSSANPADLAAAYAPRRSWLLRTAANVLPAPYVRRWGLDYEQPAAGRVVGGGVNNDGVFANVTAKPSRPIQIREGDEIFLVPEEAQKDVPPSYASAQADSVPPYWETTVHAPSSPGAFGEMIIDALPTGSLFSFLWNMLVSISFQFVGFLLTYLLHTTHAARFGSRAGLGVTLIQYGFALRSRAEDAAEADATWGWRMGGNGQMQQPPATGAPDPSPTFDTAAQAEDYYRNLNMSLPDPASAIPPATMDEIISVNDATTDWLSFFLMTIGWFILLTSILGFWRVKRWESNILASQHDAAAAAPASAPGDARSRYRALATSLQHAFGMPRTGMGGLLRGGLFPRHLGDGLGDDGDGAGGRHGEDDGAGEDDDDAYAARTAEEGRAADLRARAELLARFAHDPARQLELEESFREEDQLMENMRAAGML